VFETLVFFLKLLDHRNLVIFQHFQVVLDSVELFTSLVKLALQCLFPFVCFNQKVILCLYSGLEL
jgi:hypothetical protein